MRQYQLVCDNIIGSRIWQNLVGNALQHRYITPPLLKKPALRRCLSSLLLSKLLQLSNPSSQHLIQLSNLRSSLGRLGQARWKSRSLQGEYLKLDTGYHSRSLLWPTQLIRYFKTLRSFLTARISLTFYSLSSIIQISGRGLLYYLGNKLSIAFYSRFKEKIGQIFINSSSLTLKECPTF